MCSWYINCLLLLSFTFDRAKAAIPPGLSEVVLAIDGWIKFKVSAHLEILVLEVRSSRCSYFFIIFVYLSHHTTHTTTVYLCMHAYLHILIYMPYSYLFIWIKFKVSAHLEILLLEVRSSRCFYFSIYVHSFVYLCIHSSLHILTWTYMYSYLYIYAYLRISRSSCSRCAACIRVSLHIWIDMYLFIFMFVCVNICCGLDQVEGVHPNPTWTTAQP